jgi:hypothetical protein
MMPHGLEEALILQNPTRQQQILAIRDTEDEAVFNTLD